MGAGTLAVTDSSWGTEVDEHEGLVLADFWAEWCGPCRHIAPILDELATEMEGKVKIVKVDVDSNTEISSKFGIRSIPCLVLLKKGEEVDRSVGAQNKSQLKEWLESKA